KPIWPALDQFFARAAPPLWGSAALRLATLASAPPHPKGVETEGRKTIYRKIFTPPFLLRHNAFPLNGKLHSNVSTPDKIRQQLQVLRDLGFLTHATRGEWHL